MPPYRLSIDWAFGSGEPIETTSKIPPTTRNGSTPDLCKLLFRAGYLDGGPIEGVRVATKEQYDKAIAKAEAFGWSKLNKQEQELIKSAAKQMGDMGNRARNIFNQ